MEAPYRDIATQIVNRYGNYPQPGLTTEQNREWLLEDILLHLRMADANGETRGVLRIIKKTNNEDLAL